MADFDTLLWVAYGIGYALWLAYSFARFEQLEDPAIAMVMAFLALAWPVIVPVYVPYRIFRWLGVRPAWS